MTYKILVADDEVEGRVVIKEALTGLDVDVTEVENGQQALERATSQDFDLIVMDLAMPFVDGVEALKVIHMSEPDLPIIVVTGVQEEETKSLALKSGANILIEKPFDLPDFVSGVRKLLGIQD